MGSVSSIPNGIAYLAQYLNGLNGSSSTSVNSSPNLTSVLESATPSDAVSLTTSELELQQVDGILGLSPPSNVPTLPLPGAAGTELPPGVASSTVTNATPTEQANLANEAAALQNVQSLFNPPVNPFTTVNVLG